MVTYSDEFSAAREVEIYKIVDSPRLDEQIVQQVEESIHKGVLKLGDQLPPERELAKQFGVSRTVVREAVKALRGKGLVDAFRGAISITTSGFWRPSSTGIPWVL